LGHFGVKLLYFLQQSREKRGLACLLLHKVQQHTDKQEQEQEQERAKAKAHTSRTL
jgi:hypothetical protein